MADKDMAQTDGPPPAQAAGPGDDWRAARDTLLRELQKRHQEPKRATEPGTRADDPRMNTRYRW
jgi:hypothetical protein